MSVRHINKKRVIAGTAIAVPLGIIAAGAASAADAPAPLGGLSAVTNTVNSTATSTNVLHGITDLAMAKQAAPSVAAPAVPAAPAPVSAASPITAAVVNATQGTPLAALLPQSDTVGKHRTESKAPAATTQPAQAKHRKAKHAKDPQPLDAVTGNLGQVVDLSLVNHTVDGVTEQLGLGHTVTDALKPVTGNGGILTGLLGIKEHTAVKAQHQGRHARPAQSLVDDSALPHTGGDSAEIAMLLGAGLALTGAGARMVTRRRRQDG
jgi:LPXTG-motif cell wall-anchored protein